MSVDESVAIVLEAFRAVEQRDQQRLQELYHPEVEFHWAPSLPYGGSSRGGVRDRPGPQLVGGLGTIPVGRGGATDGPARRRRHQREVVVLYHQRGVSPSGQRFDGEVLGLYEVRDGKFARAQMFYFDAVAVQRFLAAAEAEASSRSTTATRNH